MAETYNLIQTLQKLRDDLKLWSSNNFRNVLSKLSSHEGSAEAHSAVFANYMAIENFASTDPENYKVDHAVLADGATLADNASKLDGQPASYYALASALNNYQLKLTPGDYIDITNNTIKVKDIDTTATKDSTNLITSGAVATALEDVKITLDENITNNSPNPVSGTTIYTYVTGQLANYYTKDEVNEKIAGLGEGEVTLTNSFATIAVGDTPVNLVAESATDTLKIKGGDGIELTADTNTDTLTIQTTGLMKTTDYTGTGTSIVNKADNANKLGGVSADGYALKEHVHNYEYVIELDPVYLDEAVSNNQWVSYPFTDEQINIINNNDDVLLKTNLGAVTILAYKQHIIYNDILLFTSGIMHVYEDTVSPGWTSTAYEVLVDPTDKTLAVRVHEHLRKEDINAIYALKTEIPTDYISTEDLNNKLSNYVSTTTLNNYSTTEQMNQAISEAAVTVDAEMNSNSTNPVQNKVVMQHVTDSISGYAYSKSEIDQKLLDLEVGGDGEGPTIDLSGYMAKSDYDSNGDNIVNSADKLAKTINAGNNNDIQNYAYIQFDTSHKPIYTFVDNAATEPTTTSTRLALISDLSNYYTKTEITGLGYITNTNLNTALNNYYTKTEIAGLGYITNTNLNTALSSYYQKTETYSKTEIDNAINSARVTIDTAMSADSTNPVQNKVVKQYVDDKVSGAGDMKKSTYDKDNDGVIDSALRASQLYTSDAASNQDYTLSVDGEGKVLFNIYNTTSQVTTTKEVAFKDQIPDAYTKTQVDNLISSPQITGDVFKIQDSSSNTILQADANGLSTTKVTAEEVEVRAEDNTYNVGKSLQRINQRLDTHSHTPLSILGDGGTDDQLLISAVGDDPIWVDPSEYLGVYSVTRNEMKILTSAPTAANNSGIMKFVVLASEPATRYSGYLYIITG